MSLRLRRIAVDGFRKFREPMAIEGLTDGLARLVADRLRNHPDASLATSRRGCRETCGNRRHEAA